MRRQLWSVGAVLPLKLSGSLRGYCCWLAIAPIQPLDHVPRRSPGNVGRSQRAIRQVRGNI